MSERLPIQESGNSAEYAPLTIEQLEHELPEHASPERSTTEQISEARAEVAAIAETSPTPLTNSEQQPQATGPTLVSNELRSLTAARALISIRHSLPAADKVLSKVIHQPVVRTVSNVGATTVARPSGLLTGGLLAFLGSSIYLFMASHIGLRYNYVVAGLLFIVGFVLGVSLESLAAVLKRAKH